MRFSAPVVPRPIVAILLSLGVGAATAYANGRPPATMNVMTRPGSSEIYVAATFGLLVSTDDGCSFRWICEQNVGYAGVFDPKYKIAADGTIYATTFDGLRISRDSGCTFVTAPAIPAIWVDALDLSATGEVWAATAESGMPNEVYHSTDAGMTFDPVGLMSPTIWWKSLRVAHSDAAVVYVTGYRVTDPPAAFVYRTRNGGGTWRSLPLADLMFAATPVVLVEAVDPADPDHLFVRTPGSNPPNGDRLYQSTDGGLSWTERLVTTEPIRHVLFAADGRILVADGTGGVFASTDGGMTFPPLAGQPQMNCLDQRDDGLLLACGTNWDPDFMAIGRSSDATSWQKIFRFVELAGPVTCPAGTPQHDTCGELWPQIREQFGANPPACAGGGGGDGVGSPDAPGTGGGGNGCCEAGGSAGSTIALALFVLFTGGRSRRRRR